MNFSAWDSVYPVKKLQPSFSQSHLTIEFENNKKQRIFSHKLGSVDFSRRRDINAERQTVIDEEIANVSGSRYKSIHHVYSVDQLSIKQEDGSYLVHAHGHPLGSGAENCELLGLECSEGSDNLCAIGKCIIGKISRVRGNKWRYESSREFESLKISYYVFGEELIELKPIIRGKFTTYASDQTPVVVNIDKPASLPIKIFLPPQYYFSDDFLDSLVLISDDRLLNLFNSPKSTLVGVEKRKERFVRGVALKAYENYSDGAISNQLYGSPSEQIKLTLIEVFSKAPKVWSEKCSAIISEEFNLQPNSLEFICKVYDRVFDLFTSVIQISSQSNLSISKFSYDKNLISRPVYSRLPGVAESYRSDPAFSEDEKPAQWLVSGVDDFLSKKKQSIENFYANYLDPETCSAETLDWLAQHVGLTGALWNSEWERRVKESMIRNAFGWWDREEINEFGEKTPKGEALSKLPFTNPEWVSSSVESNLMSIRLDEIETILINDQGDYDSYKAFKTLKEDFSGFSSVSQVRIDRSLWNGLIESKGSLLCVMFLVSLFGLKSHSPEELEIIDSERKIIKPRSGLRSAEISAPPLLPHKYSPLQVGTEQDAVVGNYDNQLIAGVSRVCDAEDSKNVFFRVPYYYNRNGRSWDKIEYIAKNWMASNLNVRVQYPYLSADLWAVGDAFFEPELEQVN